MTAVAMDFSQLLRSAVFLPGCFQMVRAADSEEFRLGGARDATVRIERTNERLKCDVSFLPVKAFGASKNRELNRTMARLWCLRALVIRSGAEMGQDVEIDGLIIVGAGRMDGIRYSQIFELPVGNIQVAGDGDAKKTAAQSESKSGDHTKARLKADEKHGLLSRVADHKDLIDQISLDLANGINISKKPDLDIFVAEKEDEIFDLFEGCLMEVSSDFLLLRIEKDQLSEYISGKRNTLIRSLGVAYQGASKDKK